MIKTYKQALEYIYNTIPKLEGKRYPGELGIKRQEYLLTLLGKPQDKIKVIHIAGTSGKGSTATYISTILVAHGFKVSLTVSPHLVDIRERLQINNSLITQKEFTKSLNSIIPAIEKVRNSELGNPTYFEIMQALFYYISYQNKVDYAVVECGMGGLYDSTNVVHSKDKVCVITRLGLDHTKILGKTINEIALQKAGIIKPQNTVFTIKQKPNALTKLKQTASKNHAHIEVIQKDVHFKNSKMNEKGYAYDFKFNHINLKKLQLSSFAEYQIENSSLAICTTTYIANRDKWSLESNKVRKALLDFKFEGRMTIKKFTQNGIQKTLITDGAHNPQKMATFIKSFKKLHSKEKNIFILAFKEGKDYKNILKHITPEADTIILTQFILKNADSKLFSEETEKVKNVLKKLNFRNVIVIVNPKDAISKALRESNLVIITGSLCLLSCVQNHLKKLSS